MDTYWNVEDRALIRLTEADSILLSPGPRLWPDRIKLRNKSFVQIIVRFAMGDGEIMDMYARWKRSWTK